MLHNKETSKNVCTIIQAHLQTVSKPREHKKSATLVKMNHPFDQ
jgi:hypothetical protein